MKRLLSIVVLVSLLLAWGERTIHEISHLQDLSCSEFTLHYCQAEHHCQLCDATLLSSGKLSTIVALHDPRENSEDITCSVHTEKLSHLSITASERGPPLS